MVKSREWVSLIIPAAGESRRLPGKLRKPFQKVRGQPLLRYTLSRFADIPSVKEVIVALHPQDLGLQHWLTGKTIKTVKGGSTRTASVKAALKALDSRTTLVAIHDAARPMLKSSLVRRVIREAARRGAAILAVPVTDTVKETGVERRITQTVPREKLWLAQTPQVFRKGLILEAYRRARSSATDDARLVEELGHPVSVVRGSRTNIKVTSREDLLLVGAMLKSEAALGS
jgi:2-C-methyl-D-erythritol 4-phosphate cytidylyltransferase